MILFYGFAILFSFRKLSSIWKEESECLGVSSMDAQPDSGEQNEVSKRYTDEDISHIIQALLSSSSYQGGTEALQKYLSMGKQFYSNSCKLEMKIKDFETKIQRSYFHPKPLSFSQLENWHDYLNFAESQDDFDWVCLSVPNKLHFCFLGFCLVLKLLHYIRLLKYLRDV